MALAVESMKQALGLNPGLSRARTLLGLWLYHAGQKPEGIRLCQEEVIINPDLVIAQYHMGYIFACERKWESAIYHLKQACFLEPGHDGALSNLQEISTMIKAEPGQTGSGSP